MKRLALLVLAVELVGCVEALSREDVASLHDSQALTLRIYERSQASDVRAFARAAYCSDEAVLRRSDAAAGDASGAIVCVTPR